MDKFVIIRGTKRDISDCNNISESEPQPPKEDAIVSTPCASKTAKTMHFACEGEKCSSDRLLP